MRQSENPTFGCSRNCATAAATTSASWTRQVFVAQQHLDRRRDGVGVTIVDGSQHPGCLSDSQVRYPGPLGNKRLGHGNLFGVISRDESNQHVRVNGPHGAS